MTQYVICALQMEGFHCWPEADGELAYQPLFDTGRLYNSISYSVEGI